jgi:hypothetical protein
VSWWKSLLSKVLEAVAGWGQEEITKERPQAEPKAIRRPASKYGKKVN